ncbi:ATP-grasp fold amidoligase family protein [Mycobacterium sp. Root265]|uniref:ATP-grasp fold amidoligase family protein n=1 Tax=Mycobacterium sp. Root265 TaxID=1736504 RepID=UPI003FA5DE75
MLKPNHSSGHALFGPDEKTDVQALIETTRAWWKRTPVELGEWGYGEARSLLLLEQRIPTADGHPPADYKFFVFDGRVELIQVNSGRFGNQTATFLDAEWNRLPVRWRIRPVADEPRPRELDKMLKIAQTLGADWDFIRIDLLRSRRCGLVWRIYALPWRGFVAIHPQTVRRRAGCALEASDAGASSTRPALSFCAVTRP